MQAAARRPGFATGDSLRKEAAVLRVMRRSSSQSIRWHPISRKAFRKSRASNEIFFNNNALEEKSRPRPAFPVTFR